MKRIV